MTDAQGKGNFAPKFDQQKVAHDVSWIGARLREPSTYAGLGVVLGLFGFGSNAPDLVKDISLIGMGVGGLIAIATPEPKKPPAGPPAAGAGAAALVALLIAAASLVLAAPAHAAGNGPQTKPRAVAAGPAPAKPTVVQAQQNPLVVLRQFTVADLEAALADAQAQTPPDTIAANCYAALVPFVQTQAQNPLPNGAGAFQALQKARDAKSYLANIQSPAGPLAGLNQACAPLVLDVQNTLLTLGVSVGVIANPAGAAATMAGLPAAIIAFLGLPKF